MRCDSIFYQLFQQFPSLLFQLIETPPPNAAAYRFKSVALTFSPPCSLRVKQDGACIPFLWSRGVCSQRLHL
ncbi:DUF2887 domain-containing protein [Thermosynechococcaceae cyanobacterium BACA0444]|uniref:DUF2887 domain-containing protein n=1 Tax=Pseudocalidococcus azoricus BACA0444 TaxID=2918990 RepID=A0AAE4FSV0_9CYAN|nr:DUF2887 domain-containing protein [Pseudocalidococcus azoricus BACA0444]